MKEEADTSFLQSGEVSLSRSRCGSGVGCGFAWGARRQNSFQRKRDRASAISLWTPGTCLAEKEKEKRAADNDKSRSKYISSGTLDVLELRMCTIASSQRNEMCWRGHWAPQTRAARTTGNCALQAMDWDCCECPQELLNHAALRYAPNPKDPDASETTSTSAGGDMPGKSQKLTPFHEDNKVCHNSRSRRNSWFKRMGWSRLRKQHNKSTIRCKKVRPGQTTLAACCRWPINDSSCPRLHHLLERHCWTIRQAASNLHVSGEPSNLCHRI